MFQCTWKASVCSDNEPRAALHLRVAVFELPWNKIPQSEVDSAGFTPKGENRIVHSFRYLSLIVTRGRGRMFAVSSFLPNLMLIMIKAKLFQDSKNGPLLHNARILATCPVVHKQPIFMYLFKITMFLLSISSLSCLDL